MPRTPADVLRDLLQYVRGNLKLKCAQNESDRECYTRCRAELIAEADAALSAGVEPVAWTNEANLRVLKEDEPLYYAVMKCDNTPEFNVPLYLAPPAPAVPEPCQIRSSITDAPCELPAGHDAYSSTRFHKYSAPPPAPVRDEPVAWRIEEWSEDIHNDGIHSVTRIERLWFTPNKSEADSYQDKEWYRVVPLYGSAPPAPSGWRPIAEAPLNTLVVLLDMRRRMSDDILGYRKDIGYLTEGRWWATHGETRAMTEDSYTHFMPLPPPPQEEPSDD